jgi:hypothetical protein
MQTTAILIGGPAKGLLYTIPETNWPFIRILKRPNPVCFVNGIPDFPIESHTYERKTIRLSLRPFNEIHFYVHEGMSIEKALYELINIYHKHFEKESYK